MGKVKVRIDIEKKSGKYKAEVIDHSEGASCALGNDEGILQDLLAAEIPGFGGADKGEHGATEEWKKHSSRFTEKAEEGTDAFSEDFEHAEDDRQLDNGFGV